MKIKLLDQPIESTVTHKHNGIIVETWKSFRIFESFINESIESAYKIEPPQEESPESFIRDHTNETARVTLDATSIKIDTDYIHSQNWWGVMNNQFKNILTMTYIQDLTSAGYTVKGQ